MSRTKGAKDKRKRKSGGGVYIRKPRSEEHCKNISKALIGRKCSPRPDVSERDRLRKGKKLSKEIRENISKGHTGLKYSVEHRLAISKGRIGLKRAPFSEKHKNNISKSLVGLRSGEKNPSWLGGKSFEPYGFDFNKTLKDQIRQRDNYQCRECGYFQKDLSEKLNIHHIDYDKRNNDPMNLISLCRSCHTKTGFNRHNWTDYYGNKISG